MRSPMPVTLSDGFWDSGGDVQPTEPRFQVMTVILVISLFGEQSQSLTVHYQLSSVAIGSSCLIPRCIQSYPLLSNSPYCIFHWQAFRHR
jgi:hypothetical protein